MKRVIHASIPVVLFMGLSIAATSDSRATTLKTYLVQSEFLADIGSGATFQNFDGFASGTVLTDQVPGVVFSSPNAGLEGFLPVEAVSTTGAVSSPNILGGGSVPGSTTVLQIFVLSFKPSVFGVGFNLAAQDPTASAVQVDFEFDNEDVVTRFINDRDGNENTGEFWGFVSDRPISQVVFTSGRENGGEGGFEEFGIDNLTFTAVEQSPPVCSGTPSGSGTSRGIDGTATDDNPFDTGIVSIALTSATNVTLTCTSSPFPSICGAIESGVPSASFRATPTDPSADGQGVVVATDGAGNQCTLPVTFRGIPAGAVTDTNICALNGGILLNVTGNAPASGIAACSSALPGPDDPAFPSGYQPSPPEDPFPCRVLTILSPLSGPTEMTLKKDGDFDPTLRLLFSRFDGAVFPPFTDITTSVESIANVVPDPTRLKGGGQYTQVKVACAVQPLSCSDVDNDGDGYTLCAGPTTSADCNDRNASVHPGATEVCNGIDDNCDGQVDEGNPGGGLACSVPGKTGACAAGVTACQQGSIVCNQTVFPTTEVCDGIDNDCNGQTDENSVFGGYLQPVNADGTSIFRVGRTVPFKFQLTNCAGGFISNAVATIQIFFFANHVVGSEVEDVTSAGQANTDNLYRFDPTSNQYIYNLSTKSLTAGASYLVRTTIVGDPTPHDVIISTR